MPEINERFAIMFIRNNQFYPIALTAEQDLMIQTLLRGLFESTANGKVNVIDQPFGHATNLIEDTKKDRSSANESVK